MTKFEHEFVLNAYRELIDYYLENIGKFSSYGNYKTKITSELIVNVVRRFNDIAPDYRQIILNGGLEDVKKQDPN